ncbi:MAG: sensor histidine kinase [Terracidiphilus sp.]
MPDYYHTPALILTMLLLPAFEYLYLRYRDARTLLWFLGFLFAIVSMVMPYAVGPSNFYAGNYPWLAAAAQTSTLISSALFLGSLSPLQFRIGRFNVLYVIPYTVPLVVYSALLYGVFHGISPQRPLFFVFPLLGAVSLLVVCFWGAAKGSIPAWLGVAACIALGGLAFWVCSTQGAAWALIYVECANHLLTAVLLIFVFRRISPGVVLSVLGFAAWSLRALEISPSIAGNPNLDLKLIPIVVMSSVVAAMGMILLVLEDELAMNKIAQERERRARLELEAYTNLNLSRRRVDDFDRQGDEVCQTVVGHSRFAQAALLLESMGRYRLAGSAGLDTATGAALDELAARIPVADFLAPGTAPPAIERSQTLSFDLTPWLSPGDDLKRLRFTSALAVPMTGRSAIDGALLLAGMRPANGKSADNSDDPLRADDLLPIEMLTARLQATRSQTRMLEKLINSEKFAGLGQLAGNVTQQLNNPLTVILGYASLLEETSSLDAHDRKGVDAILAEARSMKSTLDSLSRVSRPQSDQLTTVSVAELLVDMEELHRPEFLHRAIELQLSIAPALPRVACHAHQLRQAVLQCLQFSVEAVDNPSSVPGLAPAKGTNQAKSIRLEATSEGSLVQILIAHSGPGFLDPGRVFDAFVPSQAAGEIAGLGLSLCASILRDNNGRASAVNLEPSGAAIVLKLRAA